MSSLTPRLGDFPLLEKESEGDALDSVYVYGQLNFGPLSRTVFVRPLQINENKNTEKFENPSDQEAIISQRICVLLGLYDILKFKEELSSQTFSLQIHREDLSSRAFGKRKSEEYRDFVQAEKVADKIVTLVPNYTIMKSDLFLLECVANALDDSARTMVRGPYLQSLNAIL